MIKKIKTIMLICLLISSCNSQKMTSDINIDTLYWEFFVHSENQTSCIHFPLKVTDNGIIRTINKSDWVPIKEYNGFVRLFCSEKLHRDFKVNQAPKQISMDYIIPEDNLISQMTFKNLNNNWQLEELVLKREDFQDNKSFIGFFNKFMGDSIFRKERIKFPIEYSERDENSDYKIKTESAIDLSSLERHFDLQLKTKVILLIKDNEYADCKGDFRILNYQESGTSTNITYYFKNINNNWYLIKYENLSI